MMARILVKAPHLGFEIEAEGDTGAVLGLLPWVRDFAKQRIDARQRAVTEAREKQRAEAVEAIAQADRAARALLARRRAPKPLVRATRKFVRTLMYWDRRAE